MSNKLYVLVVNGLPKSGKDTFCECANDEYSVVNYSTVDTVKSVARNIFGWDGEKTSLMRDMLSDLKDLYSKYFDGPFKEVVDNIKYYKGHADILFVHSREPKEIERFREYCELNHSDSVEFYTIYIVRDSASNEGANNHADNHTHEMIYDVYICNNSTLEQFKEVSKEFFVSLFTGEIKKHVAYRP